VAQAGVVFMIVATIWIAFAGIVMAGPWEPRFQDLFQPLVILVFLSFIIATIGEAGSRWFYVYALGSAVGGSLNLRFSLPRTTASSLESADLRRAIKSHDGIVLVSAVAGVAAQAGVINTLMAGILSLILASVQFAASWFLFRWARAA
jgi:hypothetical protein